MCCYSMCVCVYLFLNFFIMCTSSPSLSSSSSSVAVAVSVYVKYTIVRTICRDSWIRIIFMIVDVSTYSNFFFCWKIIAMYRMNGKYFDCYTSMLTWQRMKKKWMEWDRQTIFCVGNLSKRQSYWHKNSFVASI